MGDRAALGRKRADPFGEAWRTRDLSRWIDALAPDVVLHSPLLSTPFQGREVARDLYGVLFAAFGEFSIKERARSGDVEFIAWHADVSGRSAEGVDVIRYGPADEVVEIRVLMRPLTSIGAFAAGVGAPFARRRSRTAGALTKLLSAPLGALFGVLDRIAPRLLPLETPQRIMAGAVKGD